MPRTKVVFHREEDGTVPILEWMDDLPSEVVAVLSHGLVKERAVPPVEIDRAIERKKHFAKNPKQHTYEE